MKRNIKKQFWVNREEAKLLQKKAKKAGLNEATLLRCLIKGYEPKEKPDERFYDFTRNLAKIGNNMNQIAMIANSTGLITADSYAFEVKKLHKFERDLYDKFLSNEDVS